MFNLGPKVLFSIERTSSLAGHISAMGVSLSSSQGPRSSVVSLPVRKPKDAIVLQSSFIDILSRGTLDVVKVDLKHVPKHPKGKWPNEDRSRFGRMLNAAIFGGVLILSKT